MSRRTPRIAACGQYGRNACPRPPWSPPRPSRTESRSTRPCSAECPGYRALKPIRQRKYSRYTTATTDTRSGTPAARPACIAFTPPEPGERAIRKRAGQWIGHNGDSHPKADYPREIDNPVRTGDRLDLIRQQHAERAEVRHEQAQVGQRDSSDPARPDRAGRPGERITADGRRRRLNQGPRPAHRTRPQSLRVRDRRARATPQAPPMAASGPPPARECGEVAFGACPARPGAGPRASSAAPRGGTDTSRRTAAARSAGAPLRGSARTPTAPCPGSRATR